MEVHLFTEDLDFFQNQSLRLSLDPQLALLNQPLPESGVFLSQGLGLPEGTRFKVLGQDLAVNATQQLQAAVVPNLSFNQIFEDLQGAAPEALPALVCLSLTLGTGVAGSADLPAGGLASVDLSAGAKGDLAYTLYQVPSANTTRLDALTALIKHARFPLRIDLADLAASGAVQHFAYNYELDLGLSVRLGADYQRQFKLFGDLFADTALQFDAQASLKASMGVSLFEKFNLTMGSLAGTSQAPPWVRVRLDRSHKRRFTAGLSFALQAQYNLGSVLIQLLEDILELQPVQEFRAALTRFADEIEPVAQGDWQGIVAKLGEKAAGELADRLDLRQFLAEGRFDEIWQTARKITTAYNNLDAELQDFWQRLLFKADLGEGSKIRTTLQDIASLQGLSLADTVKKLLDPQFAEQIGMLEALAGTTLEQLLTGLGSQPQQLIQLAAKRAQQSLTFIESFPQQVMERWRSLAQESGIAGVVAFLQNNLSSPEQLADRLTAEMQRVVTRVLGKALAAVDQADLDRLQRFAKKVSELIGKVTNFDQNWKQALGKLNGDLGFSVGAEIGYEVQRATLFDMVIDGRDAAMRDLWPRFQALDIIGFLAELPQKDDLDELPFHINQCVFTSSRLRTSTLSLFLNRLGQVFDSAQETTKRFQESRLEVLAGPPPTRAAVFTGSLLKQITKNAFNWTGTTAFQVNGQAADTDLAAPFKSEGFSWLITSSLNHPDVNAQTLAATRELLAGFGFATAAADFAIPDGGAQAFEMNLRLSLDETAVKPFLALAQRGDAAAWTPLYLATAQQFYGSPLAIADPIQGRPAWRVLPEAVLAPAFRAMVPMAVVPPPGTFIEVPMDDGETMRLNLRTTDGSLVSLGVAMTTAPKRLIKLAEAAQAVTASLTSATAETLTRRYPFLALRTIADGYRHPLFAALLAYQVATSDSGFNPTLNARGVASLRFNQNGSWDAPRWFAVGETQAAGAGAGGGPAPA